MELNPRHFKDTLAKCRLVLYLKGLAKAVHTKKKEGKYDFVDESD